MNPGSRALRTPLTDLIVFLHLGFLLVKNGRDWIVAIETNFSLSSFHFFVRLFVNAIFRL